MSQSKKEVVVYVNHKAAVLTNCPPSKYLTCEVPIKPVGVLRADRQDRWLCTGGKDERDSCLEKEIHCDHVDDIEAPMMPIFLPGYIAAPPTRTNGPPQNCRKVVEKEVCSQQVEDTNAKPIHEIFCPGIPPSPIEQHFCPTYSRNTNASIQSITAPGPASASPSESRLEMTKEQQPSAIWRNPILQQNEAFSQDTTDGQRKLSGSSPSSKHMGSKARTGTKEASFKDASPPSATVSTAIIPAKAGNRSDGVHVPISMHRSPAVTEADIPKPQQRVRSNQASQRKVNIQELISQFDEMLMLDDANVIVYDSHTEGITANPVGEELVVPHRKTRAGDTAPNQNEKPSSYYPMSVTDSRGMTDSNLNTHVHQNHDFQFYLNGNHG